MDALALRIAARLSGTHSAIDLIREASHTLVTPSCTGPPLRRSISNRLGALRAHGGCNKSCAQACPLLHIQRARLSTLFTGLRVSNASCATCKHIAVRRLTGGHARGVHSTSDIGGGHVEAFTANHHASQDLRTGRMWRTCPQAHGEVLQHQVLLDRSSASRTSAQPGTSRIRTSHSDVASASLRLPAHRL
jgi:hypothetical protein